MLRVKPTAFGVMRCRNWCNWHTNLLNMQLLPTSASAYSVRSGNAPKESPLLM
jgi:hypothetical protein